MARDMINDHPAVVVRFPIVVLSRIPLPTLAGLKPDVMRLLPLSLQMRIPISPTWSTTAGIDTYGRWADIGIGKQTIRLRYIPTGTITANTGEAITVSAPFWIAETECTQAMWVEMMGGFFSNGNPSVHKGDDLPVHNISRKDCDGFLKAVNERLRQDGHAANVRLPTFPRRCPRLSPNWSPPIRPRLSPMRRPRPSI
jgi:hypothetical protein